MNTYDQTIIDEAARQREHELQLAKIQSSMEENRLREQRKQRESRRAFIGSILGGLAFLIFFLGLGLLLATDDTVVETCIKAGNIWQDGDCLPKTTP